MLNISSFPLLLTSMSLTVPIPDVMIESTRPGAPVVTFSCQTLTAFPGTLAVRKKPPQVPVYAYPFATQRSEPKRSGTLFPPAATLKSPLTVFSCHRPDSISTA